MAITNHTNNSTESASVSMFNVAFIFLISVISILGIIFNLLLIHVTRLRKELKNTTYGTATNLLISNVILSTVTGSCALISVIQHRWIVSEWICKLLTYSLGVWIATISITYSLISMNSCLVTIFKQPFYPGIHRKTVLINIILLIWLTSLSLNIPLMYYSGTTSKLNFVCNIRYHYSSPYYFTFVMALVYLIPVLTNCLMYLRIIIYIAKNGVQNNNEIHQQSCHPYSHPLSSSHSNNTSSIGDRNKYRLDRYTLLQKDMLSTTTIKAFGYSAAMFFLAISPIFTVMLTLSFKASPHFSLSNLHLSTISLIFYLLCLTSVITQPVFIVAYDRVTAELVRKEIHYFITRKRSIDTPIHVEGATSINSHTNSRSFHNTNVGYRS